MQILVPVKRVVDYNVKVRVKSDNSGVELDGVKMSLNPFDEIALEEAVRLKEAGKAEKVVVMSVGGQGVQESLRTALALGADEAIHVVTEHETQPVGVSKVIAQLAQSRDFQLVLMGKQAIDDDANQTAQMVAARLNWPQATFASEVTLDGETLRVEREIDGGTEVVEAQLPAVVSSDLRLNEPRYASLPNIMKAKKKPLEVIEGEFDEALAPRITTHHVSPPPQRQGGGKVESVDDLLEKLKSKGVIA